MIVALLGGAGVGKTTIARAMQKRIKDSFVIDGDDLREETKNFDISIGGREANIHLGYSRARRLSDLGFTVFVAMQAPIREIREQYLNEHDVQIIIENHGKNIKDDKGYNSNFTPDYSNVTLKQVLQEFTVESFYNKVFPKVLVPARFQGSHSGHKVIFEEAKRLSPNITVGLRIDAGDIIDLDENIKLFESRGYKVIKTPGIDDDWTDFANEYDIYVQGNPMVIEKFKDSKCKLYHVPRYDNHSGTQIRKDVAAGKDVSHYIDDDVKELLERSI